MSTDRIADSAPSPWLAPKQPIEQGYMAGGSDMVLHKNSEAAIDGILAVARREVLILAAALQSRDEIAVTIASGRLQWAISCAYEFANHSPALFIRLKSRLAEIQSNAQRWLPEKPPAIRDSGHLQHVISTLSDPYLGHRAVFASDALIVGFDLDNLPLANMKLRGATMARVTARGVRLDNSDACRAVITHSCLTGASLRLAVLTGATIQECDLSHANLEGSKWRDAKVSKVTAQGALLFHSEIASAEFADSDFRDADFQGFPDSGTAGAKFVSCDLRRTNWHGRDLSAVSFIRCKLHGAFGGVAGLHLAHLEGNDMSVDGDGSLVVAKDELLTRWPPVGGSR